MAAITNGETATIPILAIRELLGDSATTQHNANRTFV